MTDSSSPSVSAGVEEEETANSAITMEGPEEVKAGKILHPINQASGESESPLVTVPANANAHISQNRQSTMKATDHQEFFGKQQKHGDEKEGLEDSYQSLAVEDIIEETSPENAMHSPQPNTNISRHLLEQSDATLMTTNLLQPRPVPPSSSRIEKLREETSGALAEETVASSPLFRRRSKSLSTIIMGESPKDSYDSIRTFEVSLRGSGTIEAAPLVQCQRTPGDAVVEASSLTSAPKRPPRRLLRGRRGEDSFSQGLRLWEHRGHDLLDASSRSGSMSVRKNELNVLTSLVGCAFPSNTFRFANTLPYLVLLIRAWRMSPTCEKPENPHTLLATWNFTRVCRVSLWVAVVGNPSWLALGRGEITRTMPTIVYEDRTAANQ